MDPGGRRVLSGLAGARVAAVDGVDDPAPGSFKPGCLVEKEIAFDGGEVAAELAVGKSAGDPAGEVAAREVIAEDGRVAVADVAAELFHCGGRHRLAIHLIACVEVEPAVRWQRGGGVFVLVPYV